MQRSVVLKGKILLTGKPTTEVSVSVSVCLVLFGFIIMVCLVFTVLFCFLFEDHQDEESNYGPLGVNKTISYFMFLF